MIEKLLPAILLTTAGCVRALPVAAESPNPCPGVVPNEMGRVVDIFEVDGERRQCCLAPPGKYIEALCDGTDMTSTVTRSCPFDPNDPTNQTYMDETAHSNRRCHKAVVECPTGMYRVAGSRTFPARCQCNEGTFNTRDKACRGHKAPPSTSTPSTSTPSTTISSTSSTSPTTVATTTLQTTTSVDDKEPSTSVVEAMGAIMPMPPDDSLSGASSHVLTAIIVPAIIVIVFVVAAVCYRHLRSTEGCSKNGEKSSEQRCQVKPLLKRSRDYVIDGAHQEGNSSSIICDSSTSESIEMTTDSAATMEIVKTYQEPASEARRPKHSKAGVEPDTNDSDGGSGLRGGQQDVDEVLDTGQCPPTLDSMISRLEVDELEGLNKDDVRKFGRSFKLNDVELNELELKQDGRVQASPTLYLASCIKRIRFKQGKAFTPQKLIGYFRKHDLLSLVEFLEAGNPLN
ncbi:unnamed protein product [Clavelina lepadiformis]|uniref:Uncharacterized protein n=1 Tax=Clavelina lepadiformis TaxID=159417 RepID=A0ABP0FJ47_CLALP